MDYHHHKKYFETAYKTGADIWTNLPAQARGLKLMEQLPQNALILDIGSGRGVFARHLVESGFRVIGIDFEGNIVNRTNHQIKDWGFEGKVKFLEGDALDIPIASDSFDGACDFGLMENLYKEDWEAYAQEVTRILKPGGFYLNVSLSRKTKKFFTFSPVTSIDGDFEKYDVHYHFFEKEEMANVFEGKLNVISQEIEYEGAKRDVAILETLFQKPL